MENKTILKYFATVATIVALICFAIFFTNNKVYRGEAEVLLIARNSVVDEKIDSLAESAKDIPFTLSFYDRLVKAGVITDPTQNMNARERKDYWQNQIRAERVSDSHIIKITAYDKDEKRAGELADIYAGEFTKTLAGYYNIRTQLDTRIIDQAITYSDFYRSFWPQAAKSIFWGVAAGLLDILIILAIPHANHQKKKFNFGRNIFSFESSAQKKTAGPDYYPIREQKKSEEKKEKKIITSGKKSSAPENLPFADDETAKLFEQKLFANGNGKKASLKEKEETPVTREKPAPADKDAATTPKEKEKEDIFREATPEEVKERLNKLLSGQL